MENSGKKSQELCEKSKKSTHFLNLSTPQIICFQEPITYVQDPVF